MSLRQVSLVLVLALAFERVNAAEPFLRGRHDIAAVATSEAQGHRTRSPALAGLIRVKSRSANATPTTAELLAWADQLRSEESSLSGEILAVQANMSGLEGLVNGLTANVSHITLALATTLQDVQASTGSRVKLEADTAVVAAPALAVLSETEGMVGNMSAVGATQMAELKNMSKWMPGNELSQQIDTAEVNLHVYEGAVKASVERALTANGSWVLQNFIREQGDVLSNLSNITGNSAADESVDCTCPPCNAAGAPDAMDGTA